MPSKVVAGNIWKGSQGQCATASYTFRLDNFLTTRFHHFCKTISISLSGLNSTGTIRFLCELDEEGEAGRHSSRVRGCSAANVSPVGHFNLLTGFSLLATHLPIYSLNEVLWQLSSIQQARMLGCYKSSVPSSLSPSVEGVIG